ncbi:hypothetical protein [Halioglobus sp. HI00S01]|uniref:hypothetical protein n=1 Tax=Halioglobus sp. HI00S01 TaxID=1822214 RepID=UPI0012E8B468|nr:hypothetical protein [Halioglobus sp. HI00S01]
MHSMLKRTSRAVYSRSLLLALLLSVWSGWALADSVQVGWVEDASGEAMILREGETLNAGVLAVLYAGDVLRLAGEDGGLQVMVNGESRALAAADGDFQVPAPEQEGLLAQLAGKVAAVLGGEADQSKTVAAVARGEEGSLGIPLLDLAGAQLAQRDSLYLPWYGGEPPYQVVVLDAFEEVMLADSGQLDAPLASFSGLEAGHRKWVLLLADSKQQLRYEAPLVAAREVPQPPAELGIDALTESGPAMSALWLYTYQDGRWALEALQQLWQLSEGGDELAAGLLAQLH